MSGELPYAGGATMDRAIRVLFLGNHTVGVRALDALHRAAKVVGVVAHPPDDEDGRVYESIFEHAHRLGLNATRMKPHSPGFSAFVRQAASDLLWVTDYRYLLPADMIATAQHGAVNLHPSLLPRYRGRAPLNWAILNGEQRLGLTAHFIDEGIDSGDIIDQQTFELGDDQDVGDALRLLYPMYTQMTERVVEMFRTGSVRPVRQDESRVSEFAARRPSDGLIDWQQPASRIRNLVRAVARPYPGAFSFVAGRKTLIWSAQLHLGTLRGESGGCCEPRDSGVSCEMSQPGDIVDSADGDPVVATAEGLLRVTELAYAESSSPVRLRVGDRLGAP